MMPKCDFCRKRFLTCASTKLQHKKKFRTDILPAELIVRRSAFISNSVKNTRKLKLQINVCSDLGAWFTTLNYCKVSVNRRWTSSVHKPRGFPNSGSSLARSESFSEMICLPRVLHRRVPGEPWHRVDVPVSIACNSRNSARRGHLCVTSVINPLSLRALSSTKVASA